jgi:hypothetical protein
MISCGFSTLIPFLQWYSRQTFSSKFVPNISIYPDDLNSFSAPAAPPIQPPAIISRGAVRFD